MAFIQVVLQCEAQLDCDWLMADWEEDERNAFYSGDQDAMEELKAQAVSVAMRSPDNVEEIEVSLYA